VTGLVLAIASAGHGAAAGTAQLTGGPPYALRTVLSLYHLPATGLSVSPDLSLASFRAADSAVETVIAFRETAGTTLGTRIGVLFFDKALSRWSALDVPEHDDRDEVPVAGGDIDRVQATQGFVYIDLHVNPSAGVLLILSRDGKTRKGLWGWSAAVLPGDRVIYQASQEHFAPVYALELRIFDAALPGTATLYPEKPWLPVRRDYIEQVATRIGAQPGGTGVTSEDFPEGPEWFDSSLVGNIVLDRGGRYAAFLVEFGDPYKPGSPRPERVVVTCDTKTPARGPRCAEQQLADLLRGGAPLDTDSLLRRAADDAASLARK
jgi:hypothetical protein